jgi:hypothetical protein
MNTFKKKSLYAALAGVGALGVTGAAQAVNVNPNGLGQALIYPYYTVRAAAGDAYNTLLSVVNSTASAKGVKVRFVEGKNSREVLDFNLYLSAFDVWTAAIIPTATGAGIVTADKSCTTPVITGTVAFVNYLLTDAAGGDLDRTREGYVEIIEMGDLLPGSTSEVAVTHVSGVPPCTPSALADSVVQANTTLGTGGLFGGLTLINVNKGADTGVDAVALEAFRTVPPAIWAPPGSILPDLTQALPATATIYRAGTAVTYPFTSGIDAVSATMMHNRLMNEIILDTGTASGTDWVITAPTKRYYVTSTTATPPFQRNFTSSGACDDVLINVWDREERTGLQPTNFSPPQGLTNTALCWEANVVTWEGKNVLASKNNVNINPSAIVTGYQNGWSLFDFSVATTGPITQHRLISLTGATFSGLPVVGFNVSTFNNNTLVDSSTGRPVDMRYGQSFTHKYTTSVTGAP